MKDGIEANGSVGGINGGYGIIIGCFNKGDVKSRSGTSADGYSSAGGISGVGADISYSYNTGSVTGLNGQVGGICGNECNYGTGIVRYCYNIGQVIAEFRAGNIIGQSSGAGIRYCYWTTELDGLGNGGSSSYSSRVSQDTLKGYASRLGTTYFADDTTGINNGFPILKWQLERNR